MIPLDTHLLSLVNRELVNPDEALEKAHDPAVMREKLVQMGHQLRPVGVEKRSEKREARSEEREWVAPLASGIWPLFSVPYSLTQPTLLLSTLAPIHALSAAGRGWRSQDADERQTCSVRTLAASFGTEPNLVISKYTA